MPAAAACVTSSSNHLIGMPFSSRRRDMRVLIPRPALPELYYSVRECKKLVTLLRLHQPHLIKLRLELIRRQVAADQRTVIEHDGRRAAQTNIATQYVVVLNR